MNDLDWAALSAELDERGYAVTPVLVPPEECAGLTRLYDDEKRFRSRIEMARYQFGLGEYKYFRYPLPPLVETLRDELYPPLAEVANRWSAWLGATARYPASLSTFLETCAQHGQTRPTPLLLRYTTGGYNCLHQDLYGEVWFPLQLTILLNREFQGGEFLLVEQRPRAQSRGHVVPLTQGQAVIFATNHRPVRGSRGWYRATLRHGVSTVTSGLRCTLGIIFHDAK